MLLAWLVLLLVLQYLVVLHLLFVRFLPRAVGLLGLDWCLAQLPVYLSRLLLLAKSEPLLLVLTM